MVPPWIGYSIWKFWVIHVLVSLVFKVFSGAELISLAKTVKLAVWAFSSNFLYDFTLFVIDMHQNMPISLFKTLFDHFHFHPPAGIIWRVILKPCHMQFWKFAMFVFRFLFYHVYVNDGVLLYIKVNVSPLCISQAPARLVSIGWAACWLMLLLHINHDSDQRKIKNKILSLQILVLIFLGILS